MAKGSSSRGGGKSKPTTLPKHTKVQVQAQDISISSAEDASDHSSKIPQELQQECLNIFRDATNPRLDDSTTLQQVKAHLFARDFAAAFGDQAHLRVYASRWSPSRALGYMHILADLEPHLLATIKAQSDVLSIASLPTLSVACLGGGAGSELVALAGWRKSLTGTEHASLVLSARMVDSADWATVVSTLHNRLTTPRDLSPYASAAVRASNTAMLSPALFHASFQHTDVLFWSNADIETSLSTTDLVTLMFTLNELYTASIPQTQALLAHLTAALRPGALLLIVDSPGSYSTVSLAGAADKKYPMVWLLDVGLLGAPTESTLPKWEKLVSEESRWFRLPLGLKYPIELENMRYQMHLYKRLGPRQEES